MSATPSEITAFIRTYRSERVADLARMRPGSPCDVYRHWLTGDIARELQLSNDAIAQPLAVEIELMREQLALDQEAAA